MTMAPAARLLAATLALSACSGDGEPALPDHGAPPALSGTLLAFDTDTTTAANTAALPPGFTQPVETVCAADTTRGFLSEFVVHGLDDPQVHYEWAPIAAGPLTTDPTVGQPEFFASGTVARLDRSMLDFRPSHPFGFDTAFDFLVDAPFRFVVRNRPGDVNDGDVIHTELESGLFPEAAFGFTVTEGDRVLVKGAWIYDCGHPEYETEIHPPTFVALARPDGAATVALAFANPYRNTQVYGDASVTTRFGDDSRLADPATGPFTTALAAAVFRAAIGQIDEFELHSLIEATHLTPLTWYVCAPARPSAQARFVASYRFVARTGVTVSAARRGDSGCLELHAEMGPSYRPFVPVRQTYAWGWPQISSEASQQVGQTLDVRQLVVDALAQRGIHDVAAVQEGSSIAIDQYAPLAPRAGADSDQPSGVVEKADDQPFPFYGRVRVGWE
jgi:hypothetical protein